MPTFPREILDRVERVWDFHQSTKYDEAASRAAQNPENPAAQPNPYRIFDHLPKTPLPMKLMDAGSPAIALMHGGLASLPESQLHPPQDLRTLATWLYMANGVVGKLEINGQTHSLRSCPSEGLCYPCEMYVAVFGMSDLDPGLYHFSPREFALRKLREGQATLSHLRRARPDLDSLRMVPAAVIVSTIFCRPAWRYRQRGLRAALLDAGRLIQTLVITAMGLGMDTKVRLQHNDLAMRELIGLPVDMEFGQAEAVQGIVVWTEPAERPMPSNDAPPANLVWEPIPRESLAPTVVPYGSILAAHDDCAAPGVAIREVRPPLTELSPLPTGMQTRDMPVDEDLQPGKAVRQVLLGRSKPTNPLRRQGVSRSDFIALNRLAFRGGTFHPICPDGMHVGLVRPFWVVHDITGMDGGVWYYHPPTDDWGLLSQGRYRLETQYICGDDEDAANAAAVCFIASNLNRLLHNAGPDAYRLANIEAGAVAERMQLAAGAIDLACEGTRGGAFLDEDIRKFLGLQKTGWEILYTMTLGVPGEEGEESDDEEGASWRD